VAACLTSARASWSDWGNGLAAPSYVVLVTELAKYATGGAAPAGLTVGSPLTLELDAGRIEPKGRVSYHGDAGKDVSLGELQGVAADGRVRFTFANAREPGVYSFEFPLRDGKGSVRRVFAFNVDARAECDLRRATEKDLPRRPAGAKGKLTIER
jgi:hypothetical protein